MIKSMEAVMIDELASWESAAGDAVTVAEANAARLCLVGLWTRCFPDAVVPERLMQKIGGPAATLRLFTDSVDTVVAHDGADAIKVWEEHCGGSYEFEHDGVIEAVPADKTITICNPDEPGTPKETRTASGWAKHNGRGFLCSTEY